MTYDWLENVPSSITAIPTYSPDFAFLQSMQMRADQQYEQGLAQVKNVYASIFNQPVTDEANKKKQQEYRRQALDQMKAVAATDLGDPKNVMAAENIMAPFHQDQILLQDQAWTSNLQNEYQKAYNTRDSSDEKVKRTFNQESLGPLEAIQEELRNAGRDPAKYKKITIPSWTPFIDVDNYLNEWKIKDKPEISWEDSLIIDPITGKEKIDPTIIHHHVNGAKSLPGWYTIINGKLGNEFSPQYTVQGTNAYNRAVKDYISTHKDTTEDDARKHISSTMYPDVLNQKKSHLDNISAQLSDSTDRIKKLKEAEKNQPNGLTKDQQVTLAQLQNDVEKLTPVVQEATTDYNEFSKPEKVNQFGKNYIISQLANTIRQQDVHRYAKGFSAETGGDSIKPNQAYFDMANLNENRRFHNMTHDYQVQQLDKEQQRIDIDKENAQTNKLKLALEYGDASGLPGGNSTGITGSRIKTAGTNYLENKNVNDIRNNLIDADHKTIGQNLYGSPAATGAETYGCFTNLLVGGSVGLTPLEQSVLNKYQLMQHNGTLPHTATGQFLPASKQDGDIYNSAIAKLKKATGVTINTPDDVTNAIIKYGTDWTKKAINDKSNIPAVKYYTTLFNNTDNVYKNVKLELDLTNKEMTDKVSKNPVKYGTIAVKDEKGYHPISKRDVEPYAFDMTAIDDNGNKYTFTKSELAEKYIHGKVKLFTVHMGETGASGENSIEIDGKTLYPLSINGRNYQEEFEQKHPSRMGQWFSAEGWTSKNGTYTNPRAVGEAITRLGNIENKFGTSSSIAEGFQKLSADIAPHSDYYKKLTGAAPIVETIEMTGKNASNVQFVQDALATGNRYSVEDASGNPITDDQTIKDLQTLANSKDFIKYAGNSFDVLLSDQYGTNKIVLDIPKIADPTDTYAGLSNRKFVIAISPDAASPLLKKIPVQRARERFDPLYDQNPDVNKVQEGAMYTSQDIHGLLEWVEENKLFKASFSYKDINPETGVEEEKYETLSIPAMNRAAGARQAFNDNLKVIARKKMGNIVEYTNKKGTSK